MLSPAAHHLLVRRDLPGNLRQRRAVLAAARSDPALQRRLVRMCREDVIFWMSLFMWQHDPSKTGALAGGPFIPFQRQIDLMLARPETHARLAPYDRGILWCLEHDKTMACEKSRWQGASWYFLGTNVWHCQFHDYRDWLWISRNADAVDDGSKKSLFWKVRHILSRQPRWLTGEVESSKLYFHFERTDSEITGEASTAKAGVGGRGSVVAVDEYPEIERGQEVREKTALTANSRFFIGTHLGSGTPFDLMCNPQLSPEIVRQRLHWTDGLPEQRAGLYRADPDRPTQAEILDKTYPFPPDYPFVLDGSPTGGPAPGVRSPWYDKKAKEIGDARAVSQNLDIDVAGSAKQFFDPVRLSRLIQAARPPAWEGDVDVSRDGRAERFVERAGGRLRLWVRPDGQGNLPAARYTTGADVSQGRGATNSCFAGIDADRSLKVAEWADPHTPEREFAAVCVALCRWLKTADGGGAYFAWENAGGVGNAFTQAVAALNYGPVYVTDDDLIKYSTGRAARKAGWAGSPAQRYRALVDYMVALFDGTLADRSERCLLECRLFEYVKGRPNEVRHAGEERAHDPTGAGVNHGDLATATFLAWMGAKDMAAGGRRAKPEPGGGVVPGSLEWLELVSAGTGRELVEVW